jgi:hypothetical protein
MYTPGISTHRGRSKQPVSGDREPRYHRPSDFSVLPQEFFGSRVKLATVCPETALMYAVLEDAFLCFQKQFKVETRRIQQARQAEEWFFADDFDWLFSFVSVCNALGLQPQFIRMQLRHWNESHLDRPRRKM